MSEAKQNFNFETFMTWLILVLFCGILDLLSVKNWLWFIYRPARSKLDQIQEIKLREQKKKTERLTNLVNTVERLKVENEEMKRKLSTMSKSVSPGSKTIEKHLQTEVIRPEMEKTEISKQSRQRQRPAKGQSRPGTKRIEPGPGTRDQDQDSEILELKEPIRQGPGSNSRVGSIVDFFHNDNVDRS